MKTHAALRELAEGALAANTVVVDGQEYLAAGSHQFRSFWTRDFAFAARGLLACGRLTTVRSQLDALLDNVRDDGLLPRVLDTMPLVRRVIGGGIAHRFGLPMRERKTTGPLVAEHVDEHGSAAMDSNLLVLLLAMDYLKASGDRAWWEKHAATWQRVLRFYDAHRDDDGLLVQPRYSDWQDSVQRVGKTFYLNVLYAAACARAAASGLEGVPEPRSRLRDAMQTCFFDGASGLFRSVHGLPHISIDGNLLAIDLGVLPAGGDAAARLYQAMKRHLLWTRGGLPGSVTDRDYPRSWTHLPAQIAGLRHYHDRLHWSWLIALAAKVARLVGDEEEAVRILDRLQALAVRDGTVVEIYGGKPGLPAFRSHLYRSEAPFSWGAGVTLDAIETRPTAA